MHKEDFCLSCFKCSGNTIKVTNKCYDNIEINIQEKYIGDTNNLGFHYDGKTFSIEYCAHCGIVQHQFPLEKEIVYEQAKPLTIHDLILEIYNGYMSHDFNNGSKKLSILAKMMPQTEFGMLSEFLFNYTNIYQVHPIYPELDEYIGWLLKKYQ